MLVFQQRKHGISGLAQRSTVSIGIACATQTSTMDEVLKQADEALYRAKKTKNAISIAN